MSSGFGWLTGVHLAVPAQDPEVVTLASDVPYMGTELLVPGFFRRNGELLGTTFLFFALMLLRSLCILEQKSRHLPFAQDEGKRLPAPWESHHTF